jgi:hypothetical protein
MLLFFAFRTIVPFDVGFQLSYLALYHLVATAISLDLDAQHKILKHLGYSYCFICSTIRNTTAKYLLLSSIS